MEVSLLLTLALAIALALAPHLLLPLALPLTLPITLSPYPIPNKVDWLHSSLEAQGAPRGTLGAPLALGVSGSAEQEILETEARAHLPKEVREMLAAVAPLGDAPPPALELRVKGHKVPYPYPQPQP